ncbi:MAG: cysteine desulfurase family protein [Polyangiaceae bacterium]
MLQPWPPTMIYADWNATTPPHPEVLAAMRAASVDGWANPSSVHTPGRAARAHVEAARAAVGALLGFDPRDIVFTSGGTEANNLALRSLAAHAPAAAVVTSAVEHPSVLRAAEQLAREGRSVIVVGVTPDGTVDLAELARAFARGPAVASIQLVNHETGILQPIAEIARLASAHGAPLHVDAVQGAGHLPPEAWAGAAAVTVTAHKLRGPKGIGAIAVRAPLRLRSMMWGGAQERGARPGTLDPIACAGFARAADLAREARGASGRQVRDALEEGLVARGGRVNGGAPRVGHVTNVSWAGWSGPEFVAALDLEGVAVSSGAACTAGTTDPSPVIAAMVGVARARSAVRFSLGPDADLDQVAEILQRVDRVLARASGHRDIT